MEIKMDYEFRSQLIKKIEEREFSERTGVHGSDLIYCLNKQALRKLEPKGNTEKETLLFSLGWSTQRWLTGALKDADEVEVDGIKVTPDASFGGIPWELKATYQSSNRPIEDNVNWIRQLMAQCYVTHTTEARLSRLEIMGDWKIKEGNRPTLSAYHFVFKQAELDRWWAVMLERRDLFLGILETGNLLPLGVALLPGSEFECNYCSYKDRCK